MARFARFLVLFMPLDEHISDVPTTPTTIPAASDIPIYLMYLSFMFIPPENSIIRNFFKIPTGGLEFMRRVFYYKVRLMFGG